MHDMDAELWRIAAQLRRMPSGEAAEWLLAHEGRGTAVLLLGHVPLTRKDNLRLAKHFLTRLPHAHATTYKVFAERLSVPDFVAVIRENLPEDASGMDLLLYYLKPVLKTAIRSPQGEEAARTLIAEIAALKSAAADGASTLH